MHWEQQLYCLSDNQYVLLCGSLTSLVAVSTIRHAARMWGACHSLLPIWTGVRLTGLVNSGPLMGISTRPSALHGWPCPASAASCLYDEMRRQRGLISPSH
jgi:hypothetical protein